MALRQRQWARKKRLELIRLLGLKCIDCKTRDYRKLEFDVIVNVDKEPNTKPRHHTMEWSWRMSFYRKQYHDGNLVLRCQKCHAKKSNKEEIE